MKVINVDETVAKAGAVQDIDGLEPKRIFFRPTGSRGPDDVELVFTPRAARRAARFLNRYANFLDPKRKQR